MDHIPRPPLPLRGMRAHHGSADDGDQLAKTAAGRTMSPTSGMCVSTAAAIATASHQQQVSPAASTAFTVSSYYKRTSPTLEAELSPNFESTLAHNVDSARIPAPPPRLVALTTPPPASKPPAPPSPLMGHAPFRASIASSMTSSSSRETGEEQVVVSHAGQPRLPANVCVSPAIPTPQRAKHAVEDYTVRPLVWPRPYRGGSPRPLVSPPLLSPPPLSKSMPVAVGIPRYASDSSSFAALVSSFSLGQSSIHSFFSRRKSGNASLSSSTQKVNRVANVHREIRTLADVMALPSSTDEAGSSAGDAGRWSCDHSGYMMKRGIGGCGDTLSNRVITFKFPDIVHCQEGTCTGRGNADSLCSRTSRSGTSSPTRHQRKL